MVEEDRDIYLNMQEGLLPSLGSAHSTSQSVLSLTNKLVTILKSINQSTRRKE